MKKKTISKILAVALTFAMVLGTAACGSKETAEAPAETPAETEAPAESEAPAETTADAVDITLWTYPIGNWGDQATVDALIEKFEAANQGINVTVEYLDYTNGDDQINTAIEGGQAPDMVMEGPERLVANWGAKGLMVDISDMWTDEAKADIYPSVEAACKDTSGKYFEYPLCMTAHTMAINKDMFEAADALQYVDVENRTWTTDDFVKAVEALVAYGQDNVAAVYCSGQGGDQGTRALVNNLYGGTFTNPEHTAYTADSAENVKALELLAGLEGVNFDAGIAGGDEIQLFVQGQLAMAFCWNVAQEKNNAEALTFDVLPMSFPSDDGKAELCGGIWGFGIFDNGDAAKIEASKTFINWVCNDEAQATESVKASTYWSVRQSLADVWTGDEMMTEYATFVPSMGDYYQVVAGWAEARTAWWNMLQQIGSGTPAADAATAFVETANAAAGK
ncbi:MAG: extracellular solute-binding protein [Clostridiales bacterium]|nr:extracellular solute-binding protein [Clostridiales bacterium]